MNPKKFIIYTLGFLFSILFIIGGINFILDDYGLFGNGDKKRIYMDEKDTKYLFSLNYVPSNFNALLLGPSLSDNIDPTKLNMPKTYNLSMAGANISELNLVLKNVVEKNKVDLVILCLDPYIVKDNGIKSLTILDNEKMQTLFSLKTIKITLKKLYYKIFPNKDTYAASYNGNITLHIASDTNSSKEILKRVEQIEQNSYNIVVNKDSLKELKDVSDFLQENNIKTIYYFHPIPYKIYSNEKYKNQYIDFRDKMIKAIAPNKYNDFNLKEYEFFTKDETNYSDSGHLSKKGVSQLSDELNKIINETIK